MPGQSFKARGGTMGLNLDGFDTVTVDGFNHDLVGFSRYDFHLGSFTNIFQKALGERRGELGTDCIGTVQTENDRFRHFPHFCRYGKRSDDDIVFGIRYTRSRLTGGVFSGYIARAVFNFFR